MATAVRLATSPWGREKPRRALHTNSPEGRDVGAPPPIRLLRPRARPCLPQRASFLVPHRLAGACVRVWEAAGWLFGEGNGVMIKREMPGFGTSRSGTLLCAVPTDGTRFHWLVTSLSNRKQMPPPPESVFSGFVTSISVVCRAPPPPLLCQQRRDQQKLPIDPFTALPCFIC